MTTRIVDAAQYTYVYCPECGQVVRFTDRAGADGLVDRDPEAIAAGIRIHLLFACEAVDR